MSALLASRRVKLLLLLAVATIAIAVLALRAVGSSLSYYSTPEEFMQQLDAEGRRWRVGGRVVMGTIVEQGGRPVAFEIEGEHGERLSIAYDGIVPNLFGPGAFVVIDGLAEGHGRLRASRVVIKHENEFFADTPPPDSPSRQLVPAGR
ncbi:MAG: cytochrome c maturation protein CcmE [Candidatus Rokubacteria bacterium]|nr:cytochrome c maturation protein CcmE [Chloroflexota bacterium]MBM4443374.1 cytochrome c maturation protein CcmE [Candidatus Rokubacteria bacterium]